MNGRTLACERLYILSKINIKTFCLFEFETNKPHGTDGIPAIKKNQIFKEQSISSTSFFNKTYGSGWMGSNCSGLM